MGFLETWQTQLNNSLAECAALAVDIQEIDLEYALIVTGLLWPLRQPVQEFDMEAIQTVNQLLGQEAKHILRLVQSWSGSNQMAVARGLNDDLALNSNLAPTLDTLITHFRAISLFSQHVEQQRSKADPAPSLPPQPMNTQTDIASETVFVTPVIGKPRVFISYARKDGEALAHKLRQDLEAEGIPVWQDRVKMEGGRDWWLQITDAIDQVEFMVLVATPAALQSEVVRREWRYARQQGVCVFPVQDQPWLQSTTLPRWMQHGPFYQLDTEWSRLVEDLQNSCETPRVPFMVEVLPDGFIPRIKLLNHISTLLIDEQGNPLSRPVALHGMGGYGKTMLAKALCHHEAIRQAFDDGILWVTLGENPGNLADRVADLIEVLTGERPGFADREVAEARLVQLLADRDILLVLDDVWHAEHLTPFLQGGSRCARVIITRNTSTLPPDSHKVEIRAMERAEAITLLGQGLPTSTSKSLQELADKLGAWPLLLKLTNSTLRDRVFNNRQPLSAALNYVNKALDKRGLTAFDARNSSARSQAVAQTLEVSRELLTPSELQRHAELVIFPSDTELDLAVLQKLWAATGQVDYAGTVALCERFFSLSLLAHFDAEAHYIVLHSIVRNYLVQEQRQQLVQLHRQFLDVFAALLPDPSQTVPRWATLSHSETYLWGHLAYHLLQAKREDQLIHTVKDLAYLANMSYLRSANAAEADLLAARQVAPQDNELAQLHQVFSQSNHLLNECLTFAGTVGTLHSRIVHFSGLAEIVNASLSYLPKPFIMARHPLPDLPSPSLIRTLTGHDTAIISCDISGDGDTLISIDRNMVLKIWNAKTGAERFSFTAHQVLGNCCVISRNGEVAVTTSWDGNVKIWDVGLGTEICSIQAHAAAIYCCAINSSGTIVVTASKDKTLKIWDAKTGAERFTLAGHDRAVTGCAISGDGKTVVSCAPDGFVKLWNTATGQLLKTLKIYDASEIHNPAIDLNFTASISTLLDCATTATGSLVVSTLPDSSLAVWNTETAREHAILKGHSGWIENCQIGSDGQLVLSASSDKTLKGWDVDSGSIAFTLEGHLRAVTHCAINANGTTIVSASLDKTLKLWDVRKASEPSIQTGFNNPTQCCSVNAATQTVYFNAPGNTLKAVDYQSQNELMTLQGHLRPITSCAVSHDKNIVVTSSQDQTLKVWDAASGTNLQTLEGHAWSVNSCALSQDGSTIVSASDDATLKIWDSTTGTERLSLVGHSRSVTNCAISQDGSTIVSASTDQTLKIWDAHNGQQRLTLQGHSANVNGCAISPNGQLVASASNDATLKIWQVESGQEKTTMQGHVGPITKCAFSPDGRWLLSASKDKTLKLWDVNYSYCLSSLRVEGALFDCAWLSPSSQTGNAAIIAVGIRGVYFFTLSL